MGRTTGQRVAGVAWFLAVVALIAGLGSSAPTRACDAVRGVIIVGEATGNALRVYVYDAQTGRAIASFFAFDASATGGVRVITSDINDDQVADIIAAPDPGSGAFVRVFDGRTLALIASFAPYGNQYNGGMRVAAPPAANQSSVIVTFAETPGNPVRAFNTQNWEQIAEIDPYDGQSGILGGDILPGSVGVQLPQVIVVPRNNIFSIVKCYLLRELGDCSIQLPPIPPEWRNGTVIIAEEEAFFTGPAFARETVLGIEATRPITVQVHNPATFAVVRAITAYEDSQSGGVELGSGDLNGDGFSDVITGPGSDDPPLVRVFDGKTGRQLRSFIVINPAYRRGVTVAWSASTPLTQRVHLPLVVR